MIFRTRLFAIVFYLLLPMTLSCAPVQRPPNILLIVADDLGMNDVASFGGSNAATPSIDAIAERGVRFTRHYTDRACSPSRAALLTGQYPNRLGFQPNGRGIAPDVDSLPRSLQSLGYITHHIGKWHLGDTAAQATPIHQGFDTTLAFNNQWLLAGNRDEQGRLTPAQPTYFDPWLSLNGKPATQYQGHLNDILTDHTLALLEQSGSEPWFINLWYYAPHTPIQPAQRFTQGQRSKSQTAENFTLLVQQMDASIGRISEQLGALGLLDKTVIIFLSDNGGTNRQLDNNYPLSGRKGEFREGGLRAPLIISAPGIKTTRSEVKDTASIMDIYPTLLELVGGKPVEGLDGVSLVPAMSGATLIPRALFWEAYTNGNRSYSYLSADAAYRLWQPSSFNPSPMTPPSPRRYELDPASGKETGREIIDSAVADTQYSDYLNWHSEVHQINVNTTPTKHGYQLSGNDFQRSPGFEGYSFGFSMSANMENLPNPQGLAQQEGVWSLSYDPEKRRFSLELAGKSVLSEAVSLLSECNSLILSGRVFRVLNHWKHSKPGTDFQLYLNGEVIAQLKDPSELDRPEALENATWLGSLADGKQAFRGEVSPPLILNIPIAEGEPYSPESAHERLCPGT